MAAQSRAQATAEELESGLLAQIEVHSIDWIPDPERHGKNWQQSMLWFLGNFQYFTIPIGFVGPSLGLSLGWTILAGVLGIAAGTLFMAFHATQGPIFGLPQMIQTRAQLGYRGVVVALFAVLFTDMAFNVADQVLMSTGLHGAFGWNTGLVAIATAAGRIAGHLRLRLGAPGVPVPAGHLVPVLCDHLSRHPDRARLRHRPAAPGRLPVRRVHGPVLGGRGVQHHLRALRLGPFAVHAAGHLAARHIAAVFFARPARRSG